MSLPASYFDDMYADSADPWSLADRWYEQRKYAVTMASLPRARFGRAFEPGCSIGVLTAQLAMRCDAVLATDIVDSVVTATATRLAHLPNVEVDRMSVPEQWPSGSFDLIVLSELGYYLDLDRLAELRERAISSLHPAGCLIAVHWRHDVGDYPLRGDTVHDVIRAGDRLVTLARHEEPDFLLDVLAKPPVFSVADEEGLLS